ncbi:MULTISPECIES: DoxX family protein [unclassified Paraburkholderia]|uniref:DoxX family protein n=1 Tax=unclassified Paraburkholderia TaxID=2615204 RepID=UPI002AB60F74|nr:MULTISPECIES: DoxX family protein [unclassified Paraburkholderia]
MDRNCGKLEKCVASASVRTRSEEIVALIGRVLIALFFLPAGLAKLFDFSGTVNEVAAGGLPLPVFCAAATIALEIGGGLALLLGYKTRVAATLLMLFTVAASVLYHPFWAISGARRMQEVIMFAQNIAVAGGLLVLAGQGGGRLSIDKD